MPAPSPASSRQAYALTLAQTYLPSGGELRAYPSPPWAALAASPLALLRRLFLPRGALPLDYAPFQLLDSLQGLCSYLRGGIAMHATLTGLGLGSASASALSATLALMLKEGASHLASLAFAYAVASSLDSEVRFWRLAADVANDVGLGLELAAPAAGARWFLPLTCLANACKAVCGVAAGATRTAISAHFAGGLARQGGALVAEVAAKEGTQETAVTLLGLLLGMLLAPALNASPTAQWTAFAALTAIHVWANAAAVSCLALRTLSRTRALLLLQAGQGLGLGQQQQQQPPLPTPRTLLAREPLLPVQYRCCRLGWCWGRGRGGPAKGGLQEGGVLRLGCSLEALRAGAERSGQPWQQHVRLTVCSSSSSSSEVEEQACTLHAALSGAAAPLGAGAEFYLLAAQGGEAWVAFSATATPRTMLLGWLAGVRLLAPGLGVPAAPQQLRSLLLAWEGAGWSTAEAALEEEGYRVQLLQG